MPLSRDIIRERFKRLGQVLWIKNDRLSKIVLFDQPSRAKRNRETLNKQGWMRSVCRCADLRRPGAPVSYE